MGKDQEESSYKKSGETVNVDWKVWKKDRKEKRKKWKEEKLIKQVEKKHKKQCLEEEQLENKAKNQLEEASGRKYTVSIALPGSILDNAQSPDLRTYLAGQNDRKNYDKDWWIELPIERTGDLDGRPLLSSGPVQADDDDDDDDIARAAVIFNVDEVVIFDELASTASENDLANEYIAVGKRGRANVQMGRILQYLECPQYLRKQLFSIQNDLQYAGLLNPLDCFHHLRQDEKSLYREGIVLQKPVQEGRGSYVGVGTKHEVQIDKLLQTGTRVTVEIDEESMSKKRWKGQVVSPSAPREKAGLYWGYNVRVVGSLSEAIKDKYDLVIGTSERGDSVDDMELPHFNNLMVVFGGLKGLEASMDADLDIKTEDPKELFNLYLNTCPDQGSRTIRTEEAILVTLANLRSLIKKAQS
ncbi:putative methyltransferase C9orf114 [Nymphon striatum]|nr:putative methyltransferase C9orf114 [Nymphon striatum]